jgi:hypothetical protein
MTDSVAISMQENLLPINAEPSTPSRGVVNKKQWLISGFAILVIGVLAVAVVALALRSNNSSNTAAPSNDASTPMSKEKIVGAEPTDGEMKVYDRTVRYTVSSSFVALKIRFFARVVDVASNTVASTAGYHSGQSALEFAIEKLFKKLMQDRVITEMPNDVSTQILLTLPSEKNADDKDAPEVELMGLGSSKSGDVVVYGRTIHYSASAYRKGLTLRYKATAKDVASGITGSASGLKSGQGAVEHAVQDCFQKLVAAGIVVPPHPKAAPGPLSVGEEPTESTEDFNFVPEGVSAEEEVEMMASKSGNVVVCGRNIHWAAGGYYKFPLSIRYKCDARDTASGVTFGTRGHKNGEDACKEAIKQVIMIDMQRGVPLNPNVNCPKSKVASEKAFNAIGDTVVSAPLEFEGEEETVPVLGGSKSGDIDVYGRKVHWSASGYLKGLSWRYKATAKDVASGVTGSASGLKSGQGAVEHAVQALFQNLIAQRIIPAPPAQKTESDVDVTVMPTVVDAILEDVEDGSQHSELDLQFADDENVEFDETTMAEGAVAVLDAESEEDDTVDPPMMLKGLFSKEGDTTVYGRVIHYKGSGYLKGLSWRYKASATDKATGISASSSGFKSGEGAVKDAITKVFQTLAARGIFPPKP